jgi:hypothetical protein
MGEKLNHKLKQFNVLHNEYSVTEFNQLRQILLYLRDEAGSTNSQSTRHERSLNETAGNQKRQTNRAWGTSVHPFDDCYLPNMVGVKN